MNNRKLMDLGGDVMNVLYQIAPPQTRASLLRSASAISNELGFQPAKEARSLRSNYELLTNQLKNELNSGVPYINRIMNLIGKGVDVDTKNMNGENAILVLSRILFANKNDATIVRETKKAILQILNKYETDPTIEDTNGFNVLDYAILSEQPEIIVKLMKKYDTQLNINQDHIKGILCDLVFNGEHDLIRLLLELGLDPVHITQKCEYYNDDTPFILAIKKGNRDLVNLFLPLVDEIPLEAAFYANTDIATMILIELLRKSSINVPYEYKEDSDEKYELIKLLIQNGANVNELKNKGLVCQAVWDDSEDFIQFLIDNDLFIDELFTECSNYEFSDDYEEPGLRETPDEKGDLTPFLMSVLTGNTKIAKLLLDKGADIDQTDSMGRTGLIMAVIMNDTDMVKFLLEHKADFDLEDDQEGWTPLIYAEELGDRDDIIDLLEAEEKRLDEEED